MKKVLVIDDIRNFKFEAKYARNSFSGMVALKEQYGWDEIWLDHDLGMVDNSDDDIKRVVLYLEYQAWRGEPYPVSLIVVHTANPVGRDYIVAALSKYYNVKVVNALEYV